MLESIKRIRAVLTEKINALPIHFKNKLVYFTFLSLLLKSVIFVGLTITDAHISFSISDALDRIRQYMIYYCCFVVAFVSFAFLFKNRWRLWFLILLNAALSFLLLVDLWYYRGFDTMPSLNIFRESSNLDHLSSSVYSMLYRVDLLFVVDILILIAVVLIKRDLYKEKRRSILAFVITFLLSTGIIAYVPVKTFILGMSDPAKGVFIVYDSNITMRDLSPIGYHVFNVGTFIRDSLPHHLSKAEKKEIQDWYLDHMEALPDNKYKGMLAGKNLIFVQIESFEKFMINHKIGDQEVTPNLNRLLANSLYFTDIHEQVNHGQSSDADFMSNTSIYPLRQESTFFSYPYNKYNSLPLLLQDKGYTTLALHPDKGSYWNWMPALKSIGFQKCYDSTNYVHDENIGMGLSDGSFLRQVEAILAKQKQPFYSFMVTLSSHAPFDLPDRFRELKLDPELDKTKLGGYFQSVHYVDKQIGIFLDNLKRDGLLDNSVVVFYGDHCGVHKFYPRDVKAVKNPEPWWLDNQGQIPLIIYQNGIKGEEISTTGGQIDFLPTVAYLMGVDEKKIENSAMGRNLLKTEGSYVVLKNRQFINSQDSAKYKDITEKGLDVADLIIKSNYFKGK